MPGTTTNLSLPYPVGSDAPNGPQQVQDLAARLDILAATTAYTPVLTAATTNPTLGTGSVAQARYTLLNAKWCALRGVIQFGTSGAAAGSGQYFISLPFTVSSAFTAGVGVAAEGSFLARDNSTSTLSTGITYCGSGATTMSLVTAASSNTINSTTPWTWAASDYISFSLVYEIA